MKLKSTLYVLALIANSAYGQVAAPSNDSIDLETSVFPRIRASDYPNKYIVSRGNVILATSNLVPTLVENQIIDSENRECKALLDRDTAALRTLWLRDFTLDAPQNDLLLGNNPIPYYVSLSRFVQKFTILDNMVITSGTESFILLNTNGKVEERKERAFTHTWSRQGFSWRLSTKSHK